MAITFACEACGKSYTVGDSLAGKSGTCKQCGRRMVVPGGGVSDAYGLDDVADESAPIPPRPAMARSGKAKAKGAPASFGPAAIVRYLVSLREPSRPGFFAFGKREAIRLVICLAAVAYIGWWANERMRWNKARVQAQAMMAQYQAKLAKPQVEPVEVTLPAFPDPGPAREVEPGVTFREVVLGPPSEVRAGPAGSGGRLWIYSPSGTPAPRSLPCVLIAPAGSNLITGMELGEGDRAEHLPYVRAGFAVVAYDLDGAVPDGPDRGQPGSPDPMVAIRALQAVHRFRDAKAGLVNARVALEYVLAKLPEVDPARISSAGHSSAGTLSVLFAETEPRLRSCVAYAPVVDPEAALGLAAVRELASRGDGMLVTTYSPRNNESKLKCPTFLFIARDDPMDGQVEAFAKRLQGQARPVTLRTVPSGGHYEPMIAQGIPEAIAWLKKAE